MKINNYKMALLAWCAIYPAVLLLNIFVLPHLLLLHVTLRTFIVSLFLVPYMIFGAIPFIRKRFNAWLTK
jgi:antibiotic biosynthesis monooxygenase (ABM) superfamily enzyme